MNNRKLVWTASALAGFLFIALLLFGTRLYLEWRVEHAFAPEQASIRSAFHSIFGDDGAITILPRKREPTEQVSLLDGTRYPIAANDQIVAVMIENHPSSRPQQRGIPEASIVYETLAEGGITRYMAVFDHQDLSKVGPVRSARPYFVDWASEYGGGYAHAGGSNAALRQLVTAPLRDFDEDGELLYRDFQYLKPHNLFVDLDAVQDFLRMRNWQNSLLAPRFDSVTTVPVDAELVSGLSIDFSFPSYVARYDFNAALGVYDRQIGGTIHRDQLGTPVRPTTIIVQFTEYTVLDDEGRLDMRTTGTGTAWYFSGGSYWQGSWQRTAGGITQFLDAAGQPISLPAGQIFIEVTAAGTVELGMRGITQ